MKESWKNIYNGHNALRRKCTQFIADHVVGTYTFQQPIRQCWFNEDGQPTAFYISKIHRADDWPYVQSFTLRFPIENDGECDDECDEYIYREIDMLTENLIMVCQQLNEELL